MSNCKEIPTPNEILDLSTQPRIKHLYKVVNDNISEGILYGKKEINIFVDNNKRDFVDEIMESDFRFVAEMVKNNLLEKGWKFKYSISSSFDNYIWIDATWSPLKDKKHIIKHIIKHIPFYYATICAIVFFAAIIAILVKL